MDDKIEVALEDEISQLEPTNQRTFLMASILVSLNLFLMVFVGLFWTNPFVHEFLTGRPL